MNTTEKSARAKELQREYVRAWRKRNPDKVKQYNREYWERKATQAAKEDDSHERK